MRNSPSPPSHVMQCWCFGVLRSRQKWLRQTSNLQKLEEKLPELYLRWTRIRVHRTEFFPFLIRILVRKTRSASVRAVAFVVFHVAFVVRISDKKLRNFIRELVIYLWCWPEGKFWWNSFIQHSWELTGGEGVTGGELESSCVEGWGNTIVCVVVAYGSTD